MITRNILTITGVVCTYIIMNMINLLYAMDNGMTGRAGSRTGAYSNIGYKPVQEECPGLEGADELFDNSLYREWCEETFEHGNLIYEAYKDIAFNLEYTPESAGTDYWQTSFETCRLRKGDCEDAVFLFFSHLPSDLENAEIIWGWVIDRKTGIAKAHVWYQLADKEGMQYVVEGFSNDWNAIIPMKIIERTETRKPILTISHLEASRLACLISKPDSLETYKLLADLHMPVADGPWRADFVKPETYKRNTSGNIRSKTRRGVRSVNSGFIGYQSMSHNFKPAWKHSVNHRMSVIMSKEISKIFRKLHELFTRYESQRKEPNIQIAYRGTHYKRNLNCR